MSPCTAKLSAYKNKHFLKYVLSSVTATPHLHLTHPLVPPSITPNERVINTKPAPMLIMKKKKNRAKPQSLFAKMDAQKKEAKPSAAIAPTIATAGEMLEREQGEMEQQEDDRI